jgi:hypothetical protein
MTAANVNDTTMFQALVEDIAPVRTPAGQRRTRPGAIHADKVMTAEQTVPTCAGVGSRRGSRGVG